MPNRIDLNITDSFGTWRTKVNNFIAAINEKIENADVGGSLTDFVGATEDSAGTEGLVPAPTNTDFDKGDFLNSDGRWSTPYHVPVTNLDNKEYPLLFVENSNLTNAITYFTPSIRYNPNTDSLICTEIYNTLSPIDVIVNEVNNIYYDTSSYIHDSHISNKIRECMNSIVYYSISRISRIDNVYIGNSKIVIMDEPNPYDNPVSTNNISEFYYNDNPIKAGEMRCIERYVLGEHIDEGSTESAKIYLVNGTCFNFVCAPVTITCPEFSSPGGTVTILLRSHHGLSNRTVDHFLVEFNDLTYTTTATNGVGEITLTVPSTATEDSEFTIGAFAFDSYGDGSKRSTATLTIKTNYVNTPSIISPTGSINASETSIVMASSAFSSTSSNWHYSTDWKITTDVIGEEIVVQALDSKDLTTHTFSNMDLSEYDGKTLYCWCRHWGNTLGNSNWAMVSVSVINSRHGEILYDTSGQPTAVIIGSYESGGVEPWNIRGRRVWIAVACMSKRTESISWGGYGTDIPTITNSVYTSNQLNNSNTGSSSGNYVSTYTTEAQMDAAFNDTGTSDELTTKILDYGKANSIDYPAAEYCDSIVLADGTHMDLPSMDVLMRIYQSRYIIDELDPTLASSGESSSDSWWLFPWSSCEYSSSYARTMHWIGSANNLSSKSYSSSNLQAFPALEIEV